MKHTPGPWIVDDWQYQQAGREHVPTIRTNTDAVAEALSLWSELADRELERLANARLIAAAPDLLVACNLVASLPLENFEQCAIGDAIRSAKSAIAKSEGGE